ncbi:MAG: Na+/H+ antiporter NhaC family protein [Bacteroidaceae bacterium]|nr:Na+/H+ antiporter NhaC family protein [Bacteroidaceae bacterium]
MEERIKDAKGLLSISPLLIFLAIYTLSSIISRDFYATSIIVSFLIACLYSILIFKDKNIESRFAVLARGAAKEDIMTMVFIFILAGAFASTAKQMGAIEATVNLTLNFLPVKMMLCGMFIASCFVSLSIGTSVGTIAALTPIACGITEKTGQNLPLMVAVIVGGAYFGDNLSFISDTTIMATKTQGCKLKDKFRYNLKIALPAAIITIVLYLLTGTEVAGETFCGEINYMLIIPYIYILVAAICGLNVMMLLSTGTILAGVIGLLHNKLTLTEWSAAMNNGIMGMGELIIVTILAGGIIEVMRETGGIEYLKTKLTRRIRSKTGAEMSIAGLVVLTDFCTANNTIAILTTGPLAKEISALYKIDPRRTASILDTFSCFAQSIIPYGAQLLIASGLACISPLEIIPYLYYPFILGLFAFLYIIFKHEK